MSEETQNQELNQETESAPDETNEQAEQVDSENESTTDEDSSNEESSDDADQVSRENVSNADDPKGVQKRINKAIAKQKAAEERLKQLEKRLEQQHFQEMSNVDPESNQVLKKPIKEDYDDPKDYLDAWIEYGEASTRARDNARKQQESYKSMQTKYESFHQREEIAKEKYDDYEKIVDNTLPVSEQMAHVLLDNKNAPDILYFLGKNRSEAERIHRLSQSNPALAAYELGKIEASLRVPKKMKSSAPPPMKQTGGVGSSLKNVENMSISELQKYLSRR